jgi:hypothetical protein
VAGSFAGKQLGILTKQNFTGSATVQATFTWDPDIAASSASVASSPARTGSGIAAANTAVDRCKLFPVGLRVADVLVYSFSSSEWVSAVSGGTLDVKTQITGGTNGRPARVRLQVTGLPPGVSATLSSGTINFNSDPGNLMHQALYSSGSNVSTVACALAFSGTESDSLSYAGSSAIVASGSRNAFDVPWNGRDTYESPNYDPTGGSATGINQSLLIAGTFTVSAVAAVSIPGPGAMTLSTSAASSNKQLVVAKPHSGHYGDDWPRASVFRYESSPGSVAISKSDNMVVPGPAPDDLPNPDPVIAPMLDNYFAPSEYGPFGRFFIEFRQIQNTWFVYTGGFDPVRDKKKDLPNDGAPSTMTIVSVTGGTAAASRCPPWPTRRAIAAVWTTSGTGGWQMKWCDNPTFGMGSTSRYGLYTTTSGALCVPARGTARLSFNGSNDTTGNPYPDFTVKLPGEPALSGSNATPWAVLYVLPCVPVVAGSGSNTFFNAPGGTAGDKNLFISVKLNGLDGVQRLYCDNGYPDENRQFTQTTVGTLSCGVDQNSVTCGSLGYSSSLNKNATPAAATADWQNTLALMTEYGHASPGSISFYRTSLANSGNLTGPGNASTYGELYDPSHHLRILAQAGTSALSLFDSNNVAIISRVPGTASLGLDDVLFAALAGCEGFDPPETVSAGAKYGRISSAQALANAGVDVVLSWTGETYPVNQLFGQYFLEKALDPEAQLNVHRTFEAAYDTFEKDLAASGLDLTEEWNDPVRVRNNHRFCGARRGEINHEAYVERVILYPPRYGVKK